MRKFFNTQHFVWKTAKCYSTGERQAVHQRSNARLCINFNIQMHLTWLYRQWLRWYQRNLSSWFFEKFQSKPCSQSTFLRVFRDFSSKNVLSSKTIFLKQLHHSNFLHWRSQYQHYANFTRKKWKKG